MGNSSSKRVYDAAASNDATTLQKLLEQMESQQPAVDRGLLAFRDGDGRTPLMVAAAKNHLRCVELLLQHGANVDFMKCMADGKDGTALHEAARNAKTHASVCELLLRYGASPFLANPAGRTPLDEAMLAGSYKIMDKMRQQAMFGMVAIKSPGNGEYKDRYVAVVPHFPFGYPVSYSKMGQVKQGHGDGEYKDRYVVIVPHFPCHSLTSCSGTVVPDPKGKQLWVFRDKKSLKPSCRLLLDGATCFWATPSDVVLRLHPSHKEPEGDMVARCDRGYCLFLRPVSSATQVHYLDTLVALADPSALQCSNATAPASPPNPPGPCPPIPSGSPNPTPSGPRPPTPSGSGGGLEGARSPSAAAPIEWEQEWTEQLHALPGESDLEFAVRLASATGEQQGHGQEGHAQLPPPQAPAPPPVASRPQGGPNTDLTHTHYPPISSTYVTAFFPTPQAAAANLPFPPTSTSATTRASTTVSTLASPLHSSAPFPPPASPSAPAVSSGHSAPPSRPTPQTQPSLTYADLVAPPAKWVEPSAPTLTEEEEDSQLFCVVCLSAPRAVGLLHGSTVHKCVCRECAARMETGTMLCPL